MTQEKELELYKAALVDWEKPIEEARNNFTTMGFCNYFDNSPYRIHYNNWIYESFERDLPTLYNQRILKDKKNYYWPGRGREPEGRAYRVEALKKAITILENILK